MGRRRSAGGRLLYAPGRGAEHAIRPLHGILQVDGYAAYKALADPARPGAPVTLASCWPHVRRRFHEIAQGGNPPIAEAALERIAKAIRHALKLWSGLALFLDDGRIEIDSNTVERSIRPIALSRKNALFAGSDQGAIHRGVIASLIETCKLNAVDPQTYLADALTRLVQVHPIRRIDDLIP